MNNKIKKINLNHSFIFFFVVNLFCILLFKFNNLNISSIFCLLLILIIGVSHGSLDHVKGKKKHANRHARTKRELSSGKLSGERRDKRAGCGSRDEGGRAKQAAEELGARRAYARRERCGLVGQSRAAGHWRGAKKDIGSKAGKGEPAHQ